jgi:hypothetical protein
MRRLSSFIMPSVTDIITYIGVPLAVLGVMPILYTTIRALVMRERIRRQFLSNGLPDTIIKGSLMSLVVEIELQRYSLSPKSRNQDEYWKVNPKASEMKGGSWSLFHWEMMRIGHYVYSVNEAWGGELRQPQAEVDFEEMVVFLMGRGARPHAEGFKMLRQSGLWTGSGTRLLVSPDTLDSVLEISPPGDSDGKLSLALHWLAKWDHRDASSLSPYWMRVEVPKRCPKKILLQNAGEPPASGSSTSTTVNVIDDPPLLLPGASITFHFLANGVQDAFPEGPTQASKALPIGHLRARSKILSGPALWFSSTATALGNTSSTQLWGYTIPNDILTFANKNTVPCGILVLLGILSQDKCPDWYRLYNPNLEAELQNADFEREQKDWEVGLFHSRKGNNYYDHHGLFNSKNWRSTKEDKAREKNKELKLTDAITSQAINSGQIAPAVLIWLQREALLPDLSAKEVVEMLLYQMIVDIDTALAIGAMLDVWKGWSDGGTMTRANLTFIIENKIAFAYAILMVDIIRGMEETVEGSLAADLQACVKVWPKVTLG